MEINISNISTRLEELNLQELKGQNLHISDKLAKLSDYNSEDYIKLLKELNTSNKLIETIEALQKDLRKLEETKLLLNDPSFKDLAEVELTTLNDEIERNLTEFEKLTAKSLENDERKAIIEIRPGVGGVEASLFAMDLYRMYTRYTNAKGLKTELYTIDYNAEGGINEVVMLVDAIDAFATFRFESGVHRVQRIPKTENLGRIHTSTASVVVMPQFAQQDIQINPNDIRIDVYRSSGPGGQSVNTTDSAVRITHLPTKIIVTCQNGKSQHKNKEMAMSILISKLKEIEEEKKSREVNQLRQQSIQDSDRSSKIRTYNFPQNRITDHRINISWYNLTEVLEGFLDEILDQTSLAMRKLLEI